MPLMVCAYTENGNEQGWLNHSHAWKMGKYSDGGHSVWPVVGTGYAWGYASWLWTHQWDPQAPSILHMYALLMKFKLHFVIHKNVRSMYIWDVLINIFSQKKSFLSTYSFIGHRKWNSCFCFYLYKQEVPLEPFLKRQNHVYLFQNKIWWDKRK